MWTLFPIRHALKSVLIETLIIAALGLALALAANRVSPRGLLLTRNYFPDTAKSGSAAIAGASTNATGTKQAPGPEAEGEMVAARLRGKGLHPIDGTEAAQLFQDLKTGRDLIVFVDARDDRHY